MVTDTYSWGLFTSTHLEGTRSTGSGLVFFFLKECMKLLVVNRPNPVHAARLGLGKGHPVPPAQQAGGGGDSGNAVNKVLRHLPFIYLNLSEDLKRYKAPLLKHKHIVISIASRQFCFVPQLKRHCNSASRHHPVVFAGRKSCYDDG